MDDRASSRRRVLGGVAGVGSAAIAALAGCLGDEEEGEVEDEDDGSGDGDGDGGDDATDSAAGDETDDASGDDGESGEEPADDGESDDDGEDDAAFVDATGEDVVTIETREGTDDEPSFVFDPAFVTVDAGTTIEWVNTDGVFHTVTSTDDLDNRSGGGEEFDATISSEGDTFEWDAEEPGRQPYYCSPHAGFMYGAIDVE